jgi:RimJ/RimL family protein N-acetyltransferase
LLAVAEVEGNIIGHGRVFPAGFGHKDRHVAEVGIALLKPYREIRIGTRLLEYMQLWATMAGYEKLAASVFSTNRRALNLFSGSGFVKEGVRARQFKINEQYVDEIFMGRFLDDAGK